jgi:hypothetical protein
MWRVFPGIVVGLVLAGCGRGEPKPDAKPRSLAEVQERDGGWPTGDGRHRVASTGFALLAYFDAGYTNRGDSPEHRTVARGLAWLSRRQVDGRFQGDENDSSLFDHAVATWAMVDAYGMTGSAAWGPRAQKAIDVLLRLRDRDGVWRDPRRGSGEDEAGDVVWVATALSQARSIALVERRQGKTPGIVVEEGAIAAVRAWLDARTDATTGRVAAVGRTDGVGALSSDALTAACLYLRLALGESRASPVVARGVVLLDAARPTLDAAGGVDLLYWLFGKRAMTMMPSETRQGWRAALFSVTTPGTPDAVASWPGDASEATRRALTLLCVPPYCDAYSGYDPRQFREDADDGG